MANLITNVNQACADLANIKKAIIDNGVEVANGTPSSEYANKVKDVYNAGVNSFDETISQINDGIEEALYSVSEGGKSYYDAFWDSFQQNGQRTNYHMAFANSPLTSETFRPKYDMNCSNCYFMFAYIGQYYKDTMQITDLSAYLESVGVTLDTSQATEIRNMFYVSPTIVRVPEISAESCTSVEGVFFSCSKLTTIDKLILRSDGTNTFSGTFDWCGNLKEIRFEGVIGNNIAFASSPLTKASFTSVIKALSPSVSGKTVTFNKSAKEAAFTTLAEWNELIDKKDNWTISLV